MKLTITCDLSGLPLTLELEGTPWQVTNATRAVRRHSATHGGDVVELEFDAEPLPADSSQPEQPATLPPGPPSTPPG